jgi:predicted nucleic acid-binding protein
VSTPGAPVPPAPVRYVVDTNVLMRYVEVASTQHGIAANALAVLMASDEVLCVTPQNLIEFWVSATRPITANGLGQAPAQVALLVTRFQTTFTVLPDTAAIFSEWGRIAAGYGVIGKQAHDARLVAAMKAHGVSHLLTFNVSHFNRYAAGEGITVIDPASVTATPAI